MKKNLFTTVGRAGARQPGPVRLRALPQRQFRATQAAEPPQPTQAPAVATDSSARRACGVGLQAGDGQAEEDCVLRV